MDLDTAGREAQRDPSGAEAQLQRPAAPGQVHQRRDHRLVILRIPVVIDVGPNVVVVPEPWARRAHVLALHPRRLLADLAPLGSLSVQARLPSGAGRTHSIHLSLPTEPSSYAISRP